MASADDRAATGAHPEADDLVLLAVDPSGPLDAAASAVRDHASMCDACAREVAAYVRTAGAARRALGEPAGADVERAGAPRVLPGAGVWAGIAAATGVRTAPDPAAVLRSLDDSRDRAPARTAPESTAPATPLPGPVPAPVPVQRRRVRWSTRALVGAAALGVVLGAVGGAVAVARGGSDGGEARDAVFAAQLDPVAGEALTVGTGSARVVAAGPGGGAQRLVVVTDGLPDVAGAAQEVWLLDPATGGLISLGHLVGGSSPDGGFPVPAGVDLGRFSAVDVSEEPFDGDEQHSGASELRGTLRPTES